MILRLFGWRGIAGLTLAAAAVLLALLVAQKLETRHWRKQSAQYERLHRAGEAALTQTVANYRAATEAARAADRAHAERVAAEQRAINERTLDDYQTRLAAVRARADQLLHEARAAPTDPGSRGNPLVPPISVAAGGAAQAAGEDRLPPEDALIATEQAIQLDELVKWVRAQARIDPNARR